MTLREGESKYSISQDPIFIVGCPRSGTTLLQAILATQDGLASLPETHFFSIISKKIGYNSGNFINSYCLEEVLQSVREMTSLEFSNAIKQELYQSSEHNKLVQKHLFELIIYTFLNRQFPDQDVSKLRWIEKTPSHFHSLERIASLYPAAQFLCIIRHPIPVILSRKRHIPVDNKISIQTLARQWNMMNRKVEEFKDKYPNNILIIRYEDLVTDLAKTMSSVTNYLNITLDKEKLHHFSEISVEFILPWEKWKNGVTSGQLQNTNSKWLKKVGALNSLIILMITGTFMQKYKYEVSKNYIKKIFQFGIRPFIKSCEMFKR